MDDETIITIQKTIRFPTDLHDKVQQDAKESDRDFSKQVIFALKQYYRLKESN